MNIEEYELGQKVSLYGIIEEINIEDIYDKENTTTLSIKTVTGKIHVNPKWEEVKLNQPKPVVPKFVADWYEAHKESLEYNLYLYQMSIYDEKAKKDDFYYWMQKTNNPVHKLINMHQFGYTVEKEKLYTVEILDKTLVKVIKEDGSYFYKMSSYFLDSKMQILRNLTEREIKQADERLWQFAKSAF